MSSHGGAGKAKEAFLNTPNRFNQRRETVSPMCYVLVAVPAKRRQGVGMAAGRFNSGVS